MWQGPANLAGPFFLCLARSAIFAGDSCRVSALSSERTATLRQKDKAAAGLPQSKTFSE
jgi:hypothetical protein